MIHHSPTFAANEGFIREFVIEYTVEYGYFRGDRDLQVEPKTRSEQTYLGTVPARSETGARQKPARTLAQRQLNAQLPGRSEI
jgi:hypothetical protein